MENERKRMYKNIFKNILIKFWKFIIPFLLFILFIIGVPFFILLFILIMINNIIETFEVKKPETIASMRKKKIKKINKKTKKNIFSSIKI